MMVKANDITDFKVLAIKYSGWSGGILGIVIIENYNKYFGKSW